MSDFKNVILEVGSGGPGTAAQTIVIPYNQSPAVYSVGGATDTLGATLTGAQIKSASLRLKMQWDAAGWHIGDLVNCDFVRVTVWYEEIPTFTGPCKVFDTTNHGQAVIKTKEINTTFNAKKRHE